MRVGFELKPVDHNDTAFNHLIMLPTSLLWLKSVQCCNFDMSNLLRKTLPLLGCCYVSKQISNNQVFDFIKGFLFIIVKGFF